MDQPSFYAIIPADVRYDKHLKPNAKLLYGEITALANRDGFCWAGNEYFAELYDVDNKTISRWISQLVGSGYLEIEVLKIEGNKRKIFTRDSPKNLLTKKSLGSDKKVNTLVTKKSLASDKKVTSIIRINNTINNTKNREEKALTFLTSNFPLRMEMFMMKFRSKINDFDAFSDDYNCKVIEEKKEWEQDVLFARLERLANNWIRSSGNFKNNNTIAPEAVAYGKPSNCF